MKKLALALLAAIISLTPMVSYASQKVVISGNNSFQGSVTATNLNPQFISDPPTFGFNAAYAALEVGYLITNQNLAASGALIEITGFDVSCMPYNPTLISPLAPGYMYDTPETTGLFGGTITVIEYTSTGAYLPVTTVVFPTSPHGGPYTNHYVKMLTTPYVPTAGSMLHALVTSHPSGSTPIPNLGCTMTAILQ